jgi:hypothetical protein
MLIGYRNMYIQRHQVDMIHMRRMFWLFVRSYWDLVYTKLYAYLDLGAIHPFLY